MVHKVVILKKAYAQFQSICDYLVNEFGERVADEFELEVEKCVASIMSFPESGHLEPIKSKYTYRSKIVGKYNKLYYFWMVIHWLSLLLQICGCIRTI